MEAGRDADIVRGGRDDGGYQTTVRRVLRQGEREGAVTLNDVTGAAPGGVYTSMLSHGDVDVRTNEHAAADSGTASTTLCSSPSSSPSPSMLTQGNMLTSHGGNTMLPLPGALPTTRGIGPLSAPPPNLPAPRPYHLPDPHNAENSYAEIPYGALPANNFDTPLSGDQGKLNHNPRNEWKQTLHSNPNLVNLNLALDYPQQRAHAQSNGFRTLDVVSGAERHGAPSLVHFRDGPDGLLPIPQPRMATMDVPPTDFKCEAERKRKRKSRQTLLMVVVMALAGIAYLGLGGMAGYFFGKSYCDRWCSAGTVSVGVMGNTTVTYAFTTLTPEVNSSLNGSSPAVGGSTSPRTGSTLPITTMDIGPTTEPPPQYCTQVGAECRCGPLGGAGGQPFSDRDDYRRLGNITGFAVKHNDYFISGLQVQYGLGHGSEHGYTEGGYRVNVLLLRGEYITSVDADFVAGRGYLSRLVVTTDRRVLGPYGGDGGQRYPIRGRKLLYVMGRSGPLIDKLGFVFDQCT